jgi:hypothetical protein
VSSNANETDRKSGTRDNSVAIGVQANEKTIRWFYDQHLAGAVGDTVAFEAWPPKFTDGWCLHEWLLVHWGAYLVVNLLSSLLIDDRCPDWRDVGSREAQREVSRSKPLHFLHDKRTAACQGWYRKSTRCYCHFLVIITVPFFVSTRRYLFSDLELHHATEVIVQSNIVYAMHHVLQHQRHFQVMRACLHVPSSLWLSMSQQSRAQYVSSLLLPFAASMPSPSSLMLHNSTLSQI